MNKKINCIMLVDDSKDDNFFHKRAIKKGHGESVILTKNTAMAALEYLKSKKEPHADLIFLDINMPGMNGWEFLREYNQLNKKLQSRAVIIMLTNSENPDDITRAKTWNLISEYRTKPLTPEIMEDIHNKYFKE